MQVQRFLDRIHPFYHAEYNPNTFNAPDYYTSKHGLGASMQEEWPALCYSYGIYDVPNICKIQDQVDYLIQHQQRTPNSVLEVGSGRGQVSCTLAYMGATVQSVDVNPTADYYHKLTNQHWFGGKANKDHRMLLGDLDTTISALELSAIDTVILVSSIEHIFPAEWQRFFNRSLQIFKNNHTQLVITNRKDYWPLGTDDDRRQDTGHIHLINDDFYNALALCGTVLFRDQSHISIKF